MSIFDINTFEIETKIDGYEITKIYTELDNTEYAVTISPYGKCVKINLYSYEMKTIDFSPEQTDINYIFPLTGNKFLIQTIYSIKIFGY